VPGPPSILSAVNHPPIFLGTSSFTASGWNGSFYPRGMKPSDYLAFYAERFHTVVVDSTSLEKVSHLRNSTAHRLDHLISKCAKTGLCVRLCIAAENAAKLSGGNSPIKAVVVFERSYCRELLTFRRYGGWAENEREYSGNPRSPVTWTVQPASHH
jgi:hypothetical protein